MPELISPPEEYGVSAVPKGWSTVGQTAKTFGTLIDQVYRLLWAGKLVGRKIDGRWYVSGDSIKARLAERKAKKV